MTLSFAGNCAWAKKAPADMSVIDNNYIKPQSGYGRPLTDQAYPDGVARRIYYPVFQSPYTEPAMIASDYIQRHGSALGIGLADLQLFSARRSLSTNHFRYQQLWNGIPVFASQLLINVRNDGVVSSVISDLREIGDIPLTPAISDEDAIGIAESAIRLNGASQLTSSELVVYSRGSAMALCWHVTIVADDPLGDWQVFVDASNGDVVATKNIICFVDGSGFTFDPNPIVSEQNSNLADSNDNNYQALTDARFDVTLRELSDPQGGFYYLTGPYVSTSPTSNRARFTDPDSFHFNRQDNKFEEVVVYYQIDSCERFYQALGFDSVMNYSITVNVNGTTEDNSWYTPSQRRITYGSGGVDDAEDGDVIIHEYGHATQFDQVPNWGQTHEGGSMGEGFGDYLTVSFFHPVYNDWDEARVFDWDANTRDNFWPGRRVDRNKHYPEDMTGQVHADGEIWSRCLWDIQNGIGYDTTLQLVLAAHFYLTPQADFGDAANAIVEADLNLYAGRHLLAIGQAFVDRGIFEELPIRLDILHDPLNDTEDINGPYDILASFTHTNPLDIATVYYRYLPDTIFQSVAMVPSGNPDEYTAALPGPGHEAIANYYVHVVDSLGIMATLPPGAPGSFLRFFAGPDTIAPIITHIPLGNQADIDWPPALVASISDNIGVDSAWLEFQINQGPMETASLSRVDTTDQWQGTFGGLAVPGDSIHYRIGATDISAAGNTAYLPDGDFYSFVIIQTYTLYYENPGFAIPDHPSGGYYDTLTISDQLNMQEVDIYVDIDHPHIGDLHFFIRNPQGLRVVLHDRTGGDGDSIVGWYDDDIMPDGPGAMSIFNGRQMSGNWLFYILDNGPENAGVVNSWTLRISGTEIVGIDGEEPRLPDELGLDQNYPNPFNPATRLAFNLPSTGHARLEVFDLLGRSVRIISDEVLPAGRHLVEWDGTTASGERASSGLYFARLIAGEKRASIRMTLLK
jgi:Zn-dependent metalloprotease/subtilisin-like proprotein convertase family protein